VLRGAFGTGVCVCVCVCMFVCVYKYIYIYIYMHTCMHTYMHTYMHTHIQISVLLAHKADAEMVNNQSKTPLHMAQKPRTLQVLYTYAHTHIQTFMHICIGHRITHTPGATYIHT
jgi:hypothetical protein